MSVRMFFGLRTLLFYFIVLYMWISESSSTECCSTTAPQMLETFRKNVLKRRTRTVIFPKKAQLLLTPSFGKAILGGIPRGLAYSMEFDMYNVLPDTVEGWKPTILFNQIEKERQQEQTQQVMEAIKAPIASNYSDEVKAQNEYYYDPSSEVDNKIYQFPFNDYEVDRKRWDFGQPKVGHGPPYLTRNGENKYINAPPTINGLSRNFHMRPYLRENSPSHYNANANGEYAAVRSQQFSDTVGTMATSWYGNQNYRERRQIFDQLETVGTIFNINVKACIKRAMCEITTHLKPYGESLMEDIIRIILTIPVPTDVADNFGNDDYSHRYEGVNCAFRFAASCPYRVMEILTKNLRNTKT